MLRLRGEPCDSAQAAELCDVVGLRDGVTATLARAPSRWEPLAVAALVLLAGASCAGNGDGAEGADEDDQAGSGVSSEDGFSTLRRMTRTLVAGYRRRRRRI